MVDLKGMSLKEQLLFIETQLPEAWEYLHTSKAELPEFDENDEVIYYWGGTIKEGGHGGH